MLPSDQMPTWDEILKEAQDPNDPNLLAVDPVRRKYLSLLHSHTGRNVISYYSAWLDRTGVKYLTIEDQDKNAFMRSIQGMDKTKGLDLILHTPGGDIAAAESLVEYLWLIFGKDIRVVVPQLAMSAGTMIACSAKSIVMGKHSSLGPIDPQYGGIPAHGVIEEFARAIAEVTTNQASAMIWGQVISKYQPTFLGQCEKAVAWSRDMVTTWLTENMFGGDPLASAKASRIVAELNDPGQMKTHNRHLSASKCQQMGLSIEKLEDDPILQELVLSIHHSSMLTFAVDQTVSKIIENHFGNPTVFVDDSAVQSQT